MARIRTHRDLLAWREAMALVELVYHETANFPKHELFGLTSQLRRGAVSVAANLAEGAARNTPGELPQFLGITCGSMAEVETQLEIASRLGLITADRPVLRQCDRVGRLVRRLRLAIANRSRS